MTFQHKNISNHGLSRFPPLYGKGRNKTAFTHINIYRSILQDGNMYAVTITGINVITPLIHCVPHVTRGPYLSNTRSVIKVNYKHKPIHVN